MKKKLQQSEAKEVAQGLVAADSTAVRLVVRSVLLLLYACHFWYAFRTITACPHKDEVFKNLIGFGGRWKFLTVVNETLISVYLLITFLIELVPSRRVKTYFKPFSDLIFTSLAWPTTLIVSTFFWSLFLYDRKLVSPSNLHLCISLMVNHGLHTLPLIVVVVEKVFIFHKYPSNLTACLTLLLGTTGYTVWTLIIYYQTNRWVYPFMKSFTPVIYLLFSGASAIVGFVFYFIGRKFGQFVWKEQLVMVNEKQKLKRF